MVTTGTMAPSITGISLVPDNSELELPIFAWPELERVDTAADSTHLKNPNMVALVSLVILLVPAISACTFPHQASGTKQQSKYFRPAGHLNYEYDPGVILPLRNGKILALGGKQLIKKPAGETIPG